MFQDGAGTTSVRTPTAPTEHVAGQHVGNDVGVCVDHDLHAGVGSGEPPPGPYPARAPVPDHGMRLDDDVEAGRLGACEIHQSLAKGGGRREAEVPRRRIEQSWPRGIAGERRHRFATKQRIDLRIPGLPEGLGSRADTFVVGAPPLVTDADGVEASGRCARRKATNTLLADQAVSDIDYEGRRQMAPEVFQMSRRGHHDHVGLERHDGTAVVAQQGPGAVLESPAHRRQDRLVEAEGREERDPDSLRVGVDSARRVLGRQHDAHVQRDALFAHASGKGRVADGEEARDLIDLDSGGAERADGIDGGVTALVSSSSNTIARSPGRSP